VAIKFLRLNADLTALSSSKVGYPDYSRKQSIASGTAVTEDGFVQAYGTAGVNSAVGLAINGHEINPSTYVGLTNTNVYRLSTSLYPVLKGDTITSTGTGTTLYFYPNR
jgi:hypothetical protein